MVLLAVFEKCGAPFATEDAENAVDSGGNLDELSGFLVAGLVWLPEILFGVVFDFPLRGHSLLKNCFPLVGQRCSTFRKDKCILALTPRGGVSLAEGMNSVKLDSRKPQWKAVFWGNL